MTSNKGKQLDLKEGPFSLLQSAMETSRQVFVSCRGQKSLVGKVRAFDKHFNLLLTNVTELTQSPTAEGGTSARPLDNILLRGDSVIYIAKLS